MTTATAKLGKILEKSMSQRPSNAELIKQEYENRAAEIELVLGDGFEVMPAGSAESEKLELEIHIGALNPIFSMIGYYESAADGMEKLGRLFLEKAEALRRVREELESEAYEA